MTKYLCVVLLMLLMMIATFGHLEGLKEAIADRSLPRAAIYVVALLIHLTVASLTLGLLVREVLKL